MTNGSVHAVLFDLDGTVLDTAPDLLAALNGLRRQRSLEPAAMDGFRHLVSRGSRAMLDWGLPGFTGADEAGQRADIDDFLAIYLADVCSRTRLFDGMAALLDDLAERGLPLAVVTNKPILLAQQVLDHLDLSRRFGAILGGDSLARRKPDPLPVLAACQQLGVAPAQALMVGDDARDIVAGRAAGCTTIAVTWGYGSRDDIAGWQPDVVIDEPGQLLGLLAGPDQSRAPATGAGRTTA